MKQITFVWTLVALLFGPLTHAKSGHLFQIAETGNPALVDVILCLNGKGPVSCQNYHVTAQELKISPTAQHYYPAAGIKVLTQGYQATGCTPYPNGYCLFATGNAIPAMISLSGAQRQNQTIAFTTLPPSSAAYNTSFTVAATASSGLPVTFSSSGACTNNGAIYTMTSGTGSCNVIANQAGDSNYNAAPSVTHTVTAVRATNTIMFTTPPPSSAVYNTSFTVVATASSGLPVMFSSSGACTNSGATYTMTSGTGTCNVIANQAETPNYYAASTVTNTVNAVLATNTVTFTTPPPSSAVYNSSFTVLATGLGTGTITYSSAGSCSNSGATYTITSDTGTCIVTATQAADSNYAQGTTSQGVTATPFLTSTLVYSSLNPSTTSTSSITLSAKVISPLTTPTAGTVTFTATPAGGSSMILCSGQSLSSGVATCTTSSLSTSTTYSIVATYSGATGYASSTSPSFTQYVSASALSATVPSAPTYVTAVPGNGQVTVSWLPPNDTGGDVASNITYTVAYWKTATDSPSSPTLYASCTLISGLSCVVNGLTNDTAYSFKVTATNTTGTAPYLAGYSSSVTPGDGLVVSLSTLALSVANSSYPALTGKPRVILLTNTSMIDITGLNITYPTGWGQTGNPKGLTNCTNTLSAGSSCAIIVIPGSNATSTCTSGIAPTPDQVTIDYSPSTTLSIPVVVLGYGCQYQGGFLFSIDDTTPLNESIGGKVSATINQSSSTLWSTTYPNYIWSTDQSSTMSSPSNISGHASLTTGQLNCNGNTDGFCDSNNILILSTTSFLAANICSGLFDSTGNSCTSGSACYTGWYLPAICEMGYDTTNYGSGCGASPGIISNMQYNLINVPGSDIAGLESNSVYYWSSTEYTQSGCVLGYCEWNQLFMSNGGGQGATVVGGTPGRVRCVRGLTN